MSDEVKFSRAAIEAAAETLFAILEKQECSLDKTQHIRGQIAGLRTALRLAGLELALAPSVRKAAKPVPLKPSNGEDRPPPLY